MIAFFYDSWEMILFFLYPGIFLGAIYDVFRILRIGMSDPQGTVIALLISRFFPNIKQKDKKHLTKKRLEYILIFVEDFIFCILFALVEILFFYHLNGGEIRIYALIISAFGFILYQKTIGRLVLYMAHRILFIMRRILYVILCVIFIPMFFIFRRIRRIVIWFYTLQTNKKTRKDKKT